MLKTKTKQTNKQINKRRINISETQKESRSRDRGKCLETEIQKTQQSTPETQGSLPETQECPGDTSVPEIQECRVPETRDCSRDTGECSRDTADRRALDLQRRSRDTSEKYF